MTDQLSLEQNQAKMVEVELASGRWLSTQDQRGRTVYYNPTTKETTRDLRLHLLRQSGWDLLSSRQRDMKESREQKTRAIDVTTMEDQLKRELGDAKALIEAYESEVTWLRLALLEAEKKLDPGELAVAETSSRYFLKNAPTAAAPLHHFHQPRAGTRTTAQEGGSYGAVKSGAAFSDRETEISILSQKLEEARTMNRKLLQRVSLDREQKNLCSRCLQDVEAIGAGAAAGATGAGGSTNPLLSSSANPSSLRHSQYSLTIPGGVGFPTTLSNPATHDAIMLSRGLHELQVTRDNEKGVTHPAAVSGPVGYLPRSYDPMKLSLTASTAGWESPMRRIQQQQQQQKQPPSAYAVFDPSTHSFSQQHHNHNADNVAETPFHKNLEGLQQLRASLEGDYPLDAHIRDPGRNDFFKSSYFTASLRGKTAGSNSNDTFSRMERGNEGLNQSQQQQQQPAASTTPARTTTAAVKNFVNQPTPFSFYKSGSLSLSTF